MQGKIGYAQAPVVKTEAAGWLYTWAWGVQAASESADDAWEFISWASSQEYEELVGTELGWAKAPAGKRTSLYENTAYTDEAPFAEATLTALEEADPADPGLQPEVVIRVEDGAQTEQVQERLLSLGAEPRAVGGASPRNQAFLGVLAGVLRVVALVNGLICLYVLVQALAVTAAERRQTIAVLRAGGARRATVTRCSWVPPPRYWPWPPRWGWSPSAWCWARRWPGWRPGTPPCRWAQGWCRWLWQCWG